MVEKGERRVRIAALLAGAALVMAFVGVADALVVARVEGQPADLTGVMVRSLGRWGPWAVLAPATVWLARALSPDTLGRARAVLTHVATGLAVVALQLALSAAIVVPSVAGLPGTPPTPELLALYVSSQLQLSLLVYPAMVAVVWAWDGRRRLELRRRREAALERELAEARLAALRHHLQPHFLFNALQAISELVREAPDAAVAVVTHLGDLLRATLDAGHRPTIPLGEELERLEPYLAIEAIRFSDRLSVEVDVPEHLRGFHVPEFLLQPLVENAVRHGIARTTGPGVVRVSAERDADRLVVRVEDDGAGATSPAPDGIGLGTTRARLATLYGEDAALDLGPAAGGGAVVEVRIPAHSSLLDPHHG